jgi:hypothetical protein
MPFESEAFTTQLAKTKGGVLCPPRPLRHDKDSLPPPLGELAKKQKLPPPLGEEAKKKKGGNYRIASGSLL